MSTPLAPGHWACICDAHNAEDKPTCWSCRRTRERSEHLRKHPEDLTLGDIVDDTSRIERLVEHAEHAPHAKGSLKRYLQSLLWELSATRSGAVAVVVHLSKDEERWLEDRASAAHMTPWGWIASLVRPKHEPAGTYDRAALAARLSTNKQERMAIIDEESAHLRPLLDAAKTREEAETIARDALDTVNQHFYWMAINERFPKEES